MKLALYDDLAAARKAAAVVERIGSSGAAFLVTRSNGTTKFRAKAEDHAAAVEEMFHRLPELFASGLHAVGHRVVHGGREHAEPEAITTCLLNELHELEHLDPTHIPQSLSVVDVLLRRFPEVPQYACFDTGFHQSMPDVARRYPLPQWTIDAGIRRYGFHGLSCESILSQLQAIDAPAAAGRILIAHLGNGASITAARDGVSIDTTMGFSPTGGLMMGTRSGDLDPTVITYLARTRGLTAEKLEQLVNEQSGLLGVSGESQDMRDLLDRSAASNAIELYCYVALKHFGALVAVLGGVDTIVFTGGIGEHAAPVREKICRGLAYLGVDFDSARNARHDAVISSDHSRVVVRVIATDEDLVIARHVVRLLAERSP